VFDYKRLNALTIKNKYPVPIIDEMLDVLVDARWFSMLALRAGYHQIQMALGEEFKTAFQIHLEQFESSVMAFVLTGALATFMSAMNDTLKEFMLKFVLVSFKDFLIYSGSRFSGMGVISNPGTSPPEGPSPQRRNQHTRRMPVLLLD
jgi:hypothetical protein